MTWGSGSPLIVQLRSNDSPSFTTTVRGNLRVISGGTIESSGGRTNSLVALLDRDGLPVESNLPYFFGDFLSEACKKYDKISYSMTFKIIIFTSKLK